MNNLAYFIEQCVDKKITSKSHSFPMCNSVIEYEQLEFHNVYKQILMEVYPNHLVVRLLSINYFTNKAEEEDAKLIDLTERRTVDVNSESVKDSTISYLRNLHYAFSGI